MSAARKHEPADEGMRWSLLQRACSVGRCVCGGSRLPQGIRRADEEAGEDVAGTLYCARCGRDFIVFMDGAAEALS